MKFVKITPDEYRRLKACELFIILLESSGVDNWEGYDWAIMTYEKQLKEINKEVDLMPFYDD